MKDVLKHAQLFDRAVEAVDQLIKERGLFDVKTYPSVSRDIVYAALKVLVEGQEPEFRNHKLAHQQRPQS